MQSHRATLLATSALMGLFALSSAAYAQGAGLSSVDKQRPADCTSADQVNHPSGACARTNTAQPGDAANAAARTGSPDNGVTSPTGQADATTSPTQTGASGSQASGASGEVVVTGSRLRNSEFTSADPIQVITSEESNLRGFIDTAQIIQNATTAGNGTQINNNFTGFVVNGGPGVNTVGLRGLNPDRTLVLLNGKRLGPAGTQGAISSVDLNTIPSTIIDRIEIIKDGSSSVYGSDAVAGIINIITKQNKDGGDITVYGSRPIDSGGKIGDIAGDYGKTFGRGYVNGSFDIYRQDALHYYDRSYLSCTQDEAFSQADGSSLDLKKPGTNATKCQNILGGLALDDQTGARYIITPGTIGNGVAGSPARYSGLTRVNCTIYNTGLCTRTAGATIDVNATRLNRALQPTEDNPAYLRSDAISPVRRYTATASAGYDLVPKYATVYGDFLYNKRQSQQGGYRQIFPDLDGANPTSPIAITGDLNEPVVLTPFGTKQEVDYYRGLVGVKGALPDLGTLKNFRYDISMQFSRSDGSYSTDFIYLDRLSAVSGPTACDVNFVNPYLGGKSMAQLEPGVACQPVNWARATSADQFTPSEKSFLTGTDTGRTTYEQSYVEGDFNGDLFQLPAGAVSGDAGFHLRRDRINDVPGQATLQGNSYGLSGSGITRGGQNVYEGFGEIGVPILRDVPLFKRLTFDVSGRYSSYSLSGEAKTYKAKVDWQVTSWLAFKYDQGTSFRAPALYELFLANQTGFVGQLGIDPCIDYTSKNPTIAKNCASQGIPVDYAGNGPTALITSGGGGRSLQPETSFSKTVGVVFQPRLFGFDFNAEVDYFQNNISNTITQFGAGNIVTQCYQQANFPSNGYCGLFTRDLNPASPTYLSITQVQNNYLNVGRLNNRGIDLTIRSSVKLPYDVTLRFSSQSSWSLGSKTQLLPGTITDTNGTVGFPRYVGNLDFRFDQGTWTLDWFVAMVGPTSDSYYGTNMAASYRGTGVPYSFIDKTPFYAISNITLRKTLPQGLTAQVGITNAFNRKPPSYSDLGFTAIEGSTPVTSQYDLYGRAVIVRLDKKF